MIPLSWKACAVLTLLLLATGTLTKCEANRAARAERMVAERTRERDDARTAFTRSEAARKAEQKNAVAAINEAAGACDARVDDARRSARTIREIVTREVPRDPQGCPVRSLVPAGDVRDALQPSATGAARR